MTARPIVQHDDTRPELLPAVAPTQHCNLCPPLYRNLRGTVHRPGCDYAASGRPWKWAEGRELETVAAFVRRDDSGLKACGHCMPFIAVERRMCTCSCGHRHYVYPDAHA